jgi:hypothetical protein
MHCTVMNGVMDKDPLHCGVVVCHVAYRARIPELEPSRMSYCQHASLDSLYWSVFKKILYRVIV